MGPGFKAIDLSMSTSFAIDIVESEEKGICYLEFLGEDGMTTVIVENRMLDVMRRVLNEETPELGTKIR